jgi:hypothetical protein
MCYEKGFFNDFQSKNSFIIKLSYLAPPIKINREIMNIIIEICYLIKFNRKIIKREDKDRINSYPL